MRARTSQEKTIDRLLVLYSIKECYEKHNLKALSETKMQKLVFLSEKRLIDRRVKALNYNFVRLLYPTFSSELSKDLTDFIRLGYLTEPWLGQTTRMKMILEDFEEIFRRNYQSLDIIDEVLSEYANVPTNRLVQMVYRMPWMKSKRVSELHIGVPMLYPLETENAHKIFKVMEDELEDLEICLNPKLSRELDRAFDEMRRGRLLSHAEVFG